VYILNLNQGDGRQNLKVTPIGKLPIQCRNVSGRKLTRESRTEAMLWRLPSKAICPGVLRCEAQQEPIREWPVLCVEFGRRAVRDVQGQPDALLREAVFLFLCRDLNLQRGPEFDQDTIQSAREVRSGTTDSFIHRRHRPAG
jgi:hypothetical protein